MNRLRALARRLDPWTALVLGGLLAMGVVILLATPGPWQRVVGEEPPVRLEAPVPEDVALFVMAGRRGACSGVVWLHLDAERHGLTAVVVAPLITGFAPGDGYASVADIADTAGPKVAALALGAALGVDMDAWVALDRGSADLALQAMFPLTDSYPARAGYRQARRAWRGAGDAGKAWLAQFRTLRSSLRSIRYEHLGVVALSNYVLGFGSVRSDLSLQGAATLAETLKGVDRSLVEVRATPVIVERCRGGRVWRADTEKVRALAQALTRGLRPPVNDRLVSERTRAARVLVVAPWPRARAVRYADEVRRRLIASAGAPVEVTLVSGGDGLLAARVARELDRRPALAVLVAPPSGDEGVAAVVADVCRTLRERGQEAVVSGPLPGDGVTGVAATEAPPAAVADGLPVSPVPRGRLILTEDAALTVAARANVQTLVRACWPQVLAPSLASTRLGLSFVAARHIGVGVVGSSEAAVATLLARLRLWGYQPSFLAREEIGPMRRGAGLVLAYRPDARRAATALAGDLRLPPGNVVRTDDAPRELVLMSGR